MTPVEINQLSDEMAINLSETVSAFSHLHLFGKKDICQSHKYAIVLAGINKFFISSLEALVPWDSMEYKNTIIGIIRKDLDKLEEKMAGNKSD